MALLSKRTVPCRYTLMTDRGAQALRVSEELGMLMNRRMSALTVTVSLVALLAGRAALAEDALKTSGQIEEVTVVGEKRETRLQKAPLAITTLSADEILKSNVNQLSDINGLVPGLSVTKNEGSERVVSIRGIGFETAQNPNSQAGVAFHIDGVYISHVMSLNQDLLDVERVEVLRGPQGTVFGQASTGGAINVISKAPKLGQFSGKVEGSFGNYDYVKGLVSVNVPVGDTVAFRATVQRFEHSGYAEATKVNGGNYGLDNANTWGRRLAFLWKPNDDFTATFSAQAFDSHNHGAAQKNIYDSDPDPRRISQDYPSTFSLQSHLYNLTFEQKLSGMKLKSVTAFQDMRKNQTVDNDRLDYADTGYYDIHVKWRDNSRTVSQELSLTSDSTGPLEWVAGLFYLNQHARQDILEFAGTDASPDLSIPDTYPVIYPYNLSYQTDTPFQHEAFAQYVQGTYALRSDLRLTAGARHSAYTTSAQPVNYYNLYGATQPRNVKGDNVTGKVGIEWDVAASHLLYSTISRGFKPKGVNFNTEGMLNTGQFEEETVNALEIGSKNSFWKNRARLNISTYYYDYKNFQYMNEDPIPYSGGTANIPKSRVFGAEFEGSALLSQSWRLDGSLTLMDGKITSDYYALDSAVAKAVRDSYPTFSPYDPRVLNAVYAATQNLKGNELPKMPKVSGTLSATYNHDFSSGHFEMRIQGIYRGEFQYRVFNHPIFDPVPAYTMYNLNLSYAPNAAPWALGLSVVNLTDEDGVNSRFTDPYGSFTTSTEYIAPRQVFATVSYRF